MKTSRYWLRLLMFTLFISIFPVLFLGIFSYTLTSYNMLDKVTKSKQQLLEQTRISVEQNIELIDRSLTQFTTLPIVLKAIRTPLEAVHFQTFNDLNQYMGHTLTSQMGINHLYFVNLKHRWIIFPNEIGPVDDATVQNYRNVFRDLKPFPLIMENNGRYPELTAMGIPEGIMLLKQIPFYSGELNSLVISQISYAQLKRWIAGSEQLGTTYILNRDMKIIGSDTVDDRPDEQLEQLAARTVPDQTPTGYETTAYNGETVYFFYQKSDYTDWTYLSVVPESLITSESRKIGWVTLFTSVAIILTMLFLSYQGSVRIYSPIRKLMKTIHVEKEKARGMNEIDFIGLSLANMRQQIAAQGKELHSFYVMKLFHGELPASELNEKIMGTHPRFLHGQQFCVIAIQIDSLEETRYVKADRDLLLFASMNIVQETIPEAHRLSLVVIRQSLVILLGVEGELPKEEARERLLEWGNQVQQNIAFYLGLPISIGFSRFFRHMPLASEALEEGLTALKYRIRFGNRMMLFIDDVEPVGMAHMLHYPEALSQQLKDAIKFNDKEKTEEILEEIIRTCFQYQGTLADYQMILIRLLSEIMNMAYGNPDYPSTLPHGQSLTKELMELQSPERIRTWFKDRVIEPVMNLIRLHTEKQYKRISGEMIRLIELDAGFEITLESIGQRLNYSPAYLGQVFRKEKGMNFSEYLTAFRMNIAKRWLQETGMTVNEIAEKLNYTNAQNFIRSFKREVGLTPGAYRAVNRTPRS